jgi:uncharacterized ubiquitin-like protein YukD
MLSKITIDLDEANQPVIRLQVSEDHSDLRDKTVKRFIENLKQGELLSIKCIEATMDSVFMGAGYSTFIIEPIPDEGYFFDEIAKTFHLSRITGNVYEDEMGQIFTRTPLGFQHAPDVNADEFRNWALEHKDGPPLMHCPNYMPQRKLIIDPDQVAS